MTLKKLYHELLSFFDWRYYFFLLRCPVICLTSVGYFVLFQQSVLKISKKGLKWLMKILTAFLILMSSNLIVHNNIFHNFVIRICLNSSCSFFLKLHIHLQNFLLMNVIRAKKVKKWKKKKKTYLSLSRVSWMFLSTNLGSIYKAALMCGSREWIFTVPLDNLLMVLIWLLTN